MVTLLAPTLLRIARRYESDEVRRVDLQQEMLIALWQSLDTFQGNACLPGWVSRVAHDVGGQHLERCRLLRRTERLRERIASYSEPHDPESILAEREQALALLGLLGCLRTREREALVLEIQGFELAEIGRAMKTSRTQARETLIRAKRRLRMRVLNRGIADESPSDALAASTAASGEPARRPSEPARARGGQEEPTRYIIERLQK